MRKRPCLQHAIIPALVAGICANAQADDSAHLGVALTAGLSGVGADLGLGINQYLGVRATVAGLNINRTGNYGTSVNWDARLKLFQAGALLDVYPFAGAFRLSAGVIKDGNKFTLNGQPSGGSYTFNGTSYPAADVANASGSVQWNKAVPYAGLGWGNLGGSAGWHFTSDLGVLITGKPTVNLNATCSPAAPAGVCSQFNANVAAEQVKLNNDVHNVTVWPVVRFGIGYAF
jgi:hypothetical protein